MIFKVTSDYGVKKFWRKKTAMRYIESVSQEVKLYRLGTNGGRNRTLILSPYSGPAVRSNPWKSRTLLKREMRS